MYILVFIILKSLSNQKLFKLKKINQECCSNMIKLCLPYSYLFYKNIPSFIPIPRIPLKILGHLILWKTLVPSIVRHHLNYANFQILTVILLRVPKWVHTWWTTCTRWRKLTNFSRQNSQEIVQSGRLNPNDMCQDIYNFFLSNRHLYKSDRKK